MGPALDSFSKAPLSAYANVILEGFPVLSSFSMLRHVILNNFFHLLLKLRSDQTVSQKKQKDLNSTNPSKNLPSLS